MSKVNSALISKKGHRLRTLAPEWKPAMIGNANGPTFTNAMSLACELEAPRNFIAAVGAHIREVSVRCSALDKAVAYAIECRELSDNGKLGPWMRVKVMVDAHASIVGLISGRTYAFRMRALGSNDLASPWSEEAVCLVP